MRGSVGAAVFAAALLAAAGVLALGLPTATSNASGVWEARDRGCYCHGPDPSPSVGFTVTGLPGRYVAGANYTIEIRVTFTDVPATANRSQGGFYLEATAGNFSVPAGMEGLVLVQGIQATQSSNGSLRRNWTLTWTAPDDPGRVITFFVFVNTVNGNRSETFGTDHWTQKTVRIGVGDEPEILGPPPPRPPFAFETYGLLAVGAALAGYALFTFYRVREPTGARGGARERPSRRKRGGNGGA